MSEILIVLAFILSVVFLRIGLKLKSHKKLVYLLFSSLSLFAAVLMLFFLPWNFGIFQNVEQASSPKVDVEPKEDPTDIEEPPVIVAPSESEEPEKRDDANGLDEKPAAPSPPSNPPPTPEPEHEPEPESKSEPEPEPAKIVIPDNGIIEYEVRKNDTLWSIAMRSGKTVDKVKQWNSLNSDVIYLGQTLVLYGKNVEPLPTPPPKTEEPSTSVASVLISQGDVQKKELAFTFDAGSDAVGIQILDVLKKHNVKATFFLTGKWVEKFPDYAKRIVKDGHDIGNHSYSHPDAVKIDASLLKQEITYAEKAIEKATGQSPRPYFRFPYGSYNSAVLQTVGAAGYPFSIQWSLDTIDWQQPKTDVFINRIIDGASNGDIILMHIGGVNTPEAVDQVIPLLRAKGYTLVTISDLLN